MKDIIKNNFQFKIIIYLMFLIPSFITVYLSANHLFSSMDHMVYTDFYNNYFKVLILFWFVITTGIFAIKYLRNNNDFRGKVKSILKRRTTILFVVVIILICLSTLKNGVTSLVINGDWYRNENLASFILYFSVYFLVGATVKSNKERKLLLNIFLISSILIGVYNIVNVVKYGNISYYRDLQTHIGIFYQFNHYGYYLVLMILLSASLCFTTKNKFLKSYYMSVFCFNSVILQFNQTLGAWLACLIVLIVQILLRYLKNRKFDLYSIGQLVLFIIISILVSQFGSGLEKSVTVLSDDVKSIIKDPAHSDSAGTGRWALWKTTAGFIVKRPFLGYGIEALQKYLSGGFGRPHNEFLQYAYFFGIPAFFSYFIGCFNVFFEWYKTRKNSDDVTLACLIPTLGYFISSFFGNTMFYTTPYFFILLGLGYFSIYRSNEF